MRSDLIKPHHLDRRAVVYVRQSSPQQALSNQESLRLQYALHQRARELGWREADIEVIDADLGLSGAAAAHRPGFKDLVARIALGEIGLVVSVEVTRLARNCSDWYPLLDICGHRGCLIADRDGIYDPGLPDGRLLLGLKGTISEVELHTIRGRLTAGLLSKAGRGELALPLPAGLVRDASGVVTKDPNREVQDRVALVFDSFLRLRTAGRVTRALREHGLMLPRGDRRGEIHWAWPTRSAVTDMLKNPAYAGAFAYGRTQRREGAGEGAVPGGRRVQVRRPGGECKITVRDRYPAYVPWATHEKIRAMLRDNKAEYDRLQTRGTPRAGAALLHGVVWCGECGHKMMVRYEDRREYVCTYLQRRHGAPVCQRLRADRIDERVAEAFLRAVSPAEMDAWSEARASERRIGAALRSAEAQQVERLRYQASLAERQFDRVDPDNRLVAAELERRWEAALQELRQAEAALARRDEEAIGDAAVTLDPVLRAEALALGERLPALWADPGVSHEHRKALLRCLVDKVVLWRTRRDAVGVRVVWRGGEASEFTVAMAVNALAALPRAAEMEARVLELARGGMHDGEIARALTAEGHRSPWRGADVLPGTVQRIRLQHRLKVKRRSRWHGRPGWVTVTEFAARLQVPRQWIRGRIRSGAIRTSRDPSGLYLMPDTPMALEAIRNLQAGRVRRVDLTPHLDGKEGH
jgi:DNA invertase Pin-like site-specific DNA recombinase